MSLNVFNVLEVICKQEEEETDTETLDDESTAEFIYGTEYLQWLDRKLPYLEV
jgi:hypothetical protein